MDRQILLTYEHKDGYFTYEWFEDIEEVEDFINGSDGENILKLTECVDCSKATNIDLNELE